MATVRKFYLLNEAGDRFGLNGERGVYFSAPEGLGYVLTPTFADLKYGFFQANNADAEPQETINGTLVFVAPNAYANYQTFVDWANAATALRLVYAPTGDTEVYKQISVNYVQKSELTKVRWLECPCSFFGLSPWYRPEATSLDMATFASGNIKRYTYTYTPSLRYGSDSAAQLSGIVYPAGHVPAALNFYFYGAVDSPVLSLVGNITGKVYGRASVDAATGPTDTLEYSSMYRDSFIRVRHADGSTEDLLDVVDLSTVPFFRAPITEPSTFTLSSDATFDGAGVLEVNYYYRSR